MTRRPRYVWNNRRHPRKGKGIPKGGIGPRPLIAPSISGPAPITRGTVLTRVIGQWPDGVVATGQWHRRLAGTTSWVALGSAAETYAIPVTWGVGDSAAWLEDGEDAEGRHGQAMSNILTVVASENIAATDWFVQEATPNEDTRRAFVAVNIADQAGKELVVYHGGSEPPADPTSQTMAVLPFVSGRYERTSTTAYAAGATIYTKIAIQDAGNPASRRWFSEDQKTFVASGPPTAMTLTWAENGTGSVSVSVLSVAWNGRPGTTGQWRMASGGSWNDFTIEDGFIADGLTDGVPTEILTRAANANGVQATATTVSVTSAAGLTLRQQIEGLADPEITPNGADMDTVWKIPGTDSLPSGMSISGTTISVSSAYVSGVALTGWDFRGYMVLVQSGATIDEVFNNLFGDNPAVPVPRSNSSYGLNVAAGGLIKELHDNTFMTGEGVRVDYVMGTLINQGRTSNSSYGRITHIHHNRFINVMADGMKLTGDPEAGGQVVEWNAFVGIKNVTNTPALWDAGTTYSLNQTVQRDNGWNYISKANGNIGNPMPTGTAKDEETTHWKGIDPHSDFITVFMAADEGVTVRRNYFEQVYVDDRGVGMTNAVRVEANIKATTDLKRITVSENVIKRTGTGGASPAIGGPGGDAAVDVGPRSYINNWLSPSRASYGTYFHGEVNGKVDAWENNRDYYTDAVIPGPTLRAPGTDPSEYRVVAFISQSEPVFTTERSGNYRELTPDDPTIDGNLTLIQRNGSGTEAGGSSLPAEITSTVTEITAANKLTVNPAMVVLANALARIAPDVKFGLVEMGESGTSRFELQCDADSRRDWARSFDMLENDGLKSCMAVFGKLPDRFAEYWWAKDAGYQVKWRESVSPVYFGQRANGETFTLGSLNADATAGTLAATNTVDHCIYDFSSSSASDKGRGVLPRTVPLDIVRHGPWSGDTPAENEGVEAFVADARFQALGGAFGPAASRWRSDGSHPILDDWSGVGEAALMFFMAPMLRAAGIPVSEPKIGNLTVDDAGEWARFSVTNGNGGALSTKRIVHGMTPPSGVLDIPEWQEVCGFSIVRSGDSVSDRYWFVRPDAPGADAYDEKYHATVVIDGGEILITPVVPFAGGDLIYYYLPPNNGSTNYYRADYPQFTAANDLLVFLDYPIEHDPAWYDPDATWGFAGWEVKPFDGPWVVNETAPEVFFTLAGNGPVFEDPSNVPANTTKIRHKWRFKIPTSSGAPLNDKQWFDQAANGFDMRYTANNDNIRLYKIEDSSSPALDCSPSVKSMGTMPRDVWREMEVYADFEEGDTGTFAFRVDGGPWTKRPFSQKGTGRFQANRKVRLYGVPTTLTYTLQAGIQIAYHEIWYTTSGVESMRVRIEGDAETVNAHEWRDPASGDAT